MFVCSTHDMTTILVHYNKLFHSPWESRIRVKKEETYTKNNSLQKNETNKKKRNRIFPSFCSHRGLLRSIINRNIYLIIRIFEFVCLRQCCARNLLFYDESEILNYSPTTKNIFVIIIQVAQKMYIYHIVQYLCKWCQYILFDTTFDAFRFIFFFGISCI